MTNTPKKTVLNNELNKIEVNKKTKYLAYKSIPEDDIEEPNDDNFIPGKTYYWESANDSSVNGKVKAEGERRVLKSNVRNLRDLGGMAASYTVGGNTTTGTIKYGKLYRGAQSTRVPALRSTERSRESVRRRDRTDRTVYRPRRCCQIIRGLRASFFMHTAEKLYNMPYKSRYFEEI